MTIERITNKEDDDLQCEECLAFSIKLMDDEQMVKELIEDGSKFSNNNLFIVFTTYSPAIVFCEECLVKLKNTIQALFYSDTDRSQVD